MLRTLAILPVFLLSGAALAATSVPNTFAAGQPARAADVNANFAALVTAANALEARIAALEAADDDLTAADVPGTYRIVSLVAGAGSSAANKRFLSKAGGFEGTVTFSANGDFTATITDRKNTYSGKAQDCQSQAANTSSTSVNGTPHLHQYTEAGCNQNAAAFSSQQTDGVNENGTGTWELGTAPNTIVIAPDGDAAFTVFMAKGGALGFALENAAINDPSNPGREFSLDVLIRQ